MTRKYHVTENLKRDKRRKQPMIKRTEYDKKNQKQYKDKQEYATPKIGDVG